MKIFNKIKRKIQKNPLDVLLKKAKKENKKKFLLAWIFGLLSFVRYPDYFWLYK